MIDDLSDDASVPFVDPALSNDNPSTEGVVVKKARPGWDRQVRLPPAPFRAQGFAGPEPALTTNNKKPAKKPAKHVGTVVLKHFEGYGLFQGKVRRPRILSAVTRRVGLAEVEGPHSSLTRR